MWYSLLRAVMKHKNNGMHSIWYHSVSQWNELICHLWTQNTYQHLCTWSTSDKDLLGWQNQYWTHRNALQKGNMIDQGMALPEYLPCFFLRCQNVGQNLAKNTNQLPRARRFARGYLVRLRTRVRDASTIREFRGWVTKDEWIIRGWVNSISIRIYIYIYAKN